MVSGDPQLAKAALDAVKQWRYPASDAGQVTTVSMNFTLSNNGPAAPDDQDSKRAQPATKTSLQPVAKVSPVYPPAAKKAGIQGLVLLRPTVATDGSVSNLEVLSGDSQLASAALAAVKQWRYAPREKSVITDVTLNFTLAENGVSGGVTGGVIGGVKEKIMRPRQWWCNWRGLYRRQWRQRPRPYLSSPNLPIPRRQKRQKFRAKSC